MWGIAGNTHSITLNAGETYLVKDDDNNQTISGSLVTSDKQIAVLSGSQHTAVCDTYGREGGIDQLVPTCLAGFGLHFSKRLWAYLSKLCGCSCY